ncbi:MAG: hypothetical protein O7G31_05615, partial [Calditrichaeota bacterium]|nr:hypothetical protein [Calditrichota bacterium]
VRQGQSLGTLLGYRFERGLHERGLDRYIHPFRMLAPIGEIYKTRAALEAAEREVARVVKLPHPDLVNAKKVAAAAKKQHTQLLAEKSKLPSQLKNAQNKVVKIDADIKKTEALIKSLGNITGPGGKPIKSPGRVAAEKKLKTLKRQRASAVLSVSGLKKRQSQINADIAKARLNSEAAERIVKDKQKLPHPDLENAQKVEKNARDNYEKLLEEKRQRFLFSPTADVQAMESMAANNVVDGLALHRRYKKGISVQPQQWNTNSIPFGEIGLPKADTSPFKKILATLQSLDNALDAVSDALSAESVYHTVQGNPLRAGITLDTIIQDEAPPPELEVIRTPRSGIGLTHRILVLFSGLLADTASWPTNSQQVRAQAEPHLNAWAARLLGNPSKVRCQAEYLHPETDEVLAAKEVSLSELALSPLDILYMKPGSDEAQRSELEQRLVYHLMRTRAAKIPANCLVRLSFTRDDSWRTDDLSFAEFLEVARAVHKVVTGARAADARDLSPPEIATPLSVDLTELKSRADAATNSFQKVQKTLLALFKKAKTASLEDIRTVLISLAHFGIDGAIPLSFEGDTPEGREVLLTQAESIEKEINRRLDKLRTSDQAIDRKDVSAEEQRDHDLERLRTIFGDDFRVLPQFQPVNETELGQAFADSDVIQDGDPFAALNWFQRIARVRDGAARLDTAFMYAEAMGHTSTNLKVGQLPYQEADRWVALPISAERPLTGGRVSLVAHFPSGFNSPEPLAGLLIDEWVEVVPNTSETTGVAFNYDRPGAYPPQAILLAVPPDNREKWDMEVLEHIVLETLDLLKLRAVDPDALERVNGIEQFLPALDFAVNLAGDTVSTDFTRAAAQSKES